MATSAWVADREPVAQLALALAGAATFCIYARCWRDWPHLVYDVTASVAVFAFIAQLVVEVAKDGLRPLWWVRLAMLAAMTVVTVGREFFAWTISGHLGCVLAVAIAQSADARLSTVERLLYWAPLPAVLAIRWLIFDKGQHAQTWAAVAFALVAAVPVAVLARVLTASVAGR